MPPSVPDMSMAEIGKMISKPWDDKDIDAIMQNFSQDMIFTDRALINTQNMDYTAYKAFSQSIMDCSEGVTIEPQTFVQSADGKTIVMEYKMHFKYVTDNKHFPAKARGQMVVVYGASISQVEDGKTKEGHQYATYLWDGEGK